MSRISACLGVIAIAVGAYSVPAQGQNLIQGEEGWGSERSQLQSGVELPGGRGDRILGGAVRGTNLFHSFTEFNIGEGNRAYFYNPDGVATIFSRVVGENRSEILGTLGVEGPANLFLLNPKGILFGPNAQLDLAGSFLATTAEQFQFSDGNEFSAVQPQVVPLLSVNLSPGLQFGVGAGTIRNQGVLRSPQNLTLAASRLELDNQLIAGQDLTLQAQDLLQIRDRPDQPFIASAGQTLNLQGAPIDIAALSHEESGLFSGADLILRSPQSVLGDARFSTGGNFRLEPLDNQSGTQTVGLRSPKDPVIRASGDVVLPFYEGASLHILAGGSVSIPQYVWIQGAEPATGLVETVALADGSTVEIDGRSQPTLDIRAGTTTPGVPLSAVGPATSADILLGPVFFAEADSNFVTGPASPLAGKVLITNQFNPNPALTGDISLNQNPNLANFMVLAERALINGSFLGGGDIHLHSKGDISINGIVNADPPAFFGTNRLLGNGGDITFSADGNIVLAPGSLVNSVGVLGGNLTLRSGGTIQAINSGFLSSSVGNVPGQKGGDIQIEAQALELNAGTISNSVVPIELLTRQGLQAAPPIASLAQADSGNVSIQVSGPVSLINESQIRSGIEAGSIGQGGDINLQAGSLLVDRSQIGSLLFRQQPDTQGNVIPGGQGSAGRINALITGSVILSGTTTTGFSSGLLTLAERGSQGGAGDIALVADTLIIRDGAFITASTRSSGDSADAAIAARTIDLLNGGKVITSTTQTDPGAGNAGQVGLLATERLRIEGADPNYQDRLTRINAYLQTDIGSGDRIDDVLVIDEGFAENSGAYAYSNSDGTTGGVLLSAPDIQMGLDSLVIADAFGNADGGAALVFSNDLVMRDGAEILARTFGAGQGGDIILAPLDSDRSSSILIDGFKPVSLEAVLNDQGQTLLVPDGGFPTGLSTNAEDGSSGNGGRIAIAATDFTLSNGAVLSARTRGLGTGGDINVDVVNLNLLNGGQILTPTIFGAPAGSINITTSNNFIASGIDSTWQPRIESITNAYAAIGETNPELLADLTPEQLARFTVDAVSPSSGLQATVEPETRFLVGSPADIGGSIQVQVGGDFLMQDGAEISVGTKGVGNAGNLQFDIAGAMELDGRSTIRAVVEQGGVGRGGNVDVQARSLTLLGASQIGAVLFREGIALDGSILPGAIGSAGNIRINVEDLALFSGSAPGENSDINITSGLLASTEQGAQGPAGSISLTTQQLQVTDGASITASTSNASPAGNIQIVARDQLEVNQQGSIQVLGASTGNPGNLLIATPKIRMNNAGQISASSAAGENANIELRLGAEGILFDCCDSEITAEAFGVGAGGNILITGTGNILSRLEDNNDIVANAVGQGGRVIVPFTRGRLIESFVRNENARTPNSDLTANSVLGLDGVVEAESDVVTPELPPVFVVDRPNQISRSCTTDTLARSEFVVTGRSGLPYSPMEGPLQLPNHRTDWLPLPASETFSAQHRLPLSLSASRQVQPILEAQQWQRNARGQIQLVATTGTALSQMPHPTCTDNRNSAT